MASLHHARTTSMAFAPAKKQPLPPVNTFTLNTSTMDSDA